MTVVPGAAEAARSSEANISARESWSLAFLSIAFIFTIVAALLATIPEYQPGRPLWLDMPAPYFVAYLASIVAVFMASRPRTRFVAAMVAGFLTVLPLVLLAPYGHLHDTSRNLLVAMETYEGSATGMYRDAYPGYWTFIGLVHDLAGYDAWSFIRLYPLAAVAAYTTLGYLALREVMRRTNATREVVGRATGVALLILLAIGPLVWMRTNLAPESYGLSMGMFMTYLALRRRESVLFVLTFASAAAALTVSHPLSPLLVLPALLAVIGMGSSTFREGVLKAIRAFPGEIAGTLLVMWSGWLVYRSDWIFNHAKGIVVEALVAEKEVTGVTRTIEGTEWFVLANVAFAVLLGLALAPYVLRSWRTDLGRFAILWVLFMAPILVGSAGGKFFSRPILVLLLPLAAVVGFAHAALPWRRALKIAAVALVVLAAAVGVARTGYVESYDRPTHEEVAIHGYVYDLGETPYRTAIAIHFTPDGHPVDVEGILRGGGRALDPVLAQTFSLRIVSVQSLAYVALDSEAKGSPEEAARETCKEASVIFDNGGAYLCRGVAAPPRGLTPPQV